MSLFGGVGSYAVLERDDHQVVGPSSDCGREREFDPIGRLAPATGWSTSPYRAVEDFSPHGLSVLISTGLLRQPTSAFVAALIAPLCTSSLRDFPGTVAMTALAPVRSSQDSRTACLACALPDAAKACDR